MGTLQMLDPLCPTSWHGQPVPERRWLIPGLLIRGTVTMLNGDGGVGKSLLVQQLATAMATARPFLGIEAPPRPVKSLAVFCEDDFGELHFRQARINAHYGCGMDDLQAMTLLSRVGLENGLMTFERRTDEGATTPFYHQLEHMIRESGAELIVIDTAADSFIGNENIRTQVRQFVGALRRLAKINDGGVILNAHPSLTGLNSGSGLSGSTAWHNTVRGRLYLTKPTTTEGEADESTDQRVLKLMKSNYGRAGEAESVWRDRLRARGAGAPLDRQRRRPHRARQRGAVGPAQAGGKRRAGRRRPRRQDRARQQGARLPSCRHWTWHAVIAAQERLIASGRIQTVEMGPRSKRRVYVRPHDMRLPGEVDIGNAGA